MGGIYIHIPFCAKACHYCDFHFSTDLSRKNELVEAILLEISNRKNEVFFPIETIYLGGGTPSLLDSDELSKLMLTLKNSFDLSGLQEVTLEANPEDITEKNLRFWKDYGVNRLSIGIQSFNDEILRFFNRNHDSQKAIRSVLEAYQFGIENISIDLIYGATQDIETWKKDLNIAFSLPISHLSCYQLTIEDKTVFGNWHRKGKLSIVSEDHCAEQLSILEEQINVIGWDWYEISNFSKIGCHSKHNSAYWKNKPYLGVGPSAHSFDGQYTRKSNVSSNAHYLDLIQRNGTAFHSQEILNDEQRDIEKTMTALRTKWGLKLDELSIHIDIENILQNPIISHYFLANLLILNDSTLTLTSKGFYMADKIILDIISAFDHN